MAAPAKELLNAGEICRRVTQLVRAAVEPSIRVTAEVSPRTGWIHGNSREIEQMLLDLARNARDAMPDGGDLLLSAANFDRETGDRVERFVRIAVADNGIGIRPQVRKGAMAAMKRMGGELRVRSAPGLGSSCEILLPRVEDAGLTAAAALPAAA